MDVWGVKKMKSCVHPRCKKRATYKIGGHDAGLCTKHTEMYKDELPLVRKIRKNIKTKQKTK